MAEEAAEGVLREGALREGAAEGALREGALREGAAGEVPAAGVGAGDDEGAEGGFALPVSVPPAPGAGAGVGMAERVADARCTGRPDAAWSDAGVVRGRVVGVGCVPGTDAFADAARCTGSSLVVVPVVPVVPVGAGPVRGTGRCPGAGAGAEAGAGAAVSSPEREMGGPRPALGRRPADRWTTGPADVAPGEVGRRSPAEPDSAACADSGAGAGWRVARGAGVLPGAGVLRSGAGACVGAVPASRTARWMGVSNPCVPSLRAVVAGSVLSPVLRVARGAGVLPGAGVLRPRVGAGVGAVLVSRTARWMGVLGLGVLALRSVGVGPVLWPVLRVARGAGVLPGAGVLRPRVGAGVGAVLV
ncbi:hypothetical protein ACFU2J_32690, partial [Streptomyces sp. NPDC057387]